MAAKVLSDLDRVTCALSRQGCGRVWAILIILMIAGAVTGCSVAAATDPDELRSPFLREFRTIYESQGVSALSWSHDGRYISINSENPNRNWVSIFDLKQDENLWSKKKSPFGQAGIFSSDSRQLFSQLVIDESYPSYDLKQDFISIVDVATGKNIRISGPVPDGDYNIARALAGSADGRYIATAHGNFGRIRIWNDDGSLFRDLDFLAGTEKKPTGIKNICFDLDRDFVVVASNTSEMTVVQISTGAIIKQFRSFSLFMNSMALNPVTAEVLTGASSFEVVEYPPPGQPIDYSRAAREDPKSSLRAWDAKTGTITKVYPGRGVGVESIAVSPDGRVVAATTGGGMTESYLLLWDAKTGQSLGGLSFGPNHWAMGLAFSPDSKSLAYGLDSHIHIVELKPDLVH